MDKEKQEFRKIFKKKNMDKLSLIINFWGKFIIIIMFSLIFYSFYWYSTDSGTKNGALYIGSIMLILLPSLIEYPMVSKKIHTQTRKLTVYLMVLFSVFSFVLLAYYSYIEEYIVIKKIYLPIITLFAIPITREFLTKILENRPPNIQILFHDKSKMSDLKTGIQEWYYYDLPSHMKKQGLPIFIKNNSNQSIVISNIRLELLDTIFLVPSSSARRICRLRSKKYPWIYLYHDYSLGSPLTIQPKEGYLLFIRNKELMIFQEKINRMEEPFSRIVQPMYVTAIDSFNLKEYSSEKVYYPTVNLYYLT